MLYKHILNLPLQPLAQPLNTNEFLSKDKFFLRASRQPGMDPDLDCWGWTLILTVGV